MVSNFTRVSERIDFAVAQAKPPVDICLTSGIGHCPLGRYSLFPHKSGQNGLDLQDPIS
jgi:hypothetical protein